MLVVENERESIKVLDECKALQRQKSLDYQNPASSVKQAQHYRRGIDTIYDMMDQKMIRAKSIIEGGVMDPQFEKLEDTFKDIINYASFAVSYLRGKMDGQNPKHDQFNKPKPAQFTGVQITNGAQPVNMANHRDYPTFLQETGCSGPAPKDVDAKVEVNSMMVQTAGNKFQKVTYWSDNTFTSEIVDS